jgi:uncharacterized protein (TIGR02996 family)
VTVTSEDDFHRMLDEKPDDWQTRLIFADWLQDCGDPRAEGYRAIAAQRRHPLQGHNRNTPTWWWHCPPPGSAPTATHNNLPADWFARLPPGPGTDLYWPSFNIGNGVKTRRECEDALALAFASLPAARRAELLAPAKSEPGQEGGGPALR